MGDSGQLLHEKRGVDDHESDQRAKAIRSVLSVEANRILQDQQRGHERCESCDKWTDCGVTNGHCADYRYQPGSDYGNAKAI